MKASRPVLLCGALLLFLAGCASEPEVVKPDTVPLMGMVYDLDGRAVVQAQVLLDAEDPVWTGIDGRFYFPEVATGAHRVSARSDQHEPVELTFLLSRADQVLYLSMASAGQLLRQAEEALVQADWARTRELIIRAQEVGAPRLAAGFLEATLLRRQDRPEQAAALLRQLLRGTDAPPLQLALADIQQYDLLDLPAAAESLQNYLVVRYDADVANRLHGLQQQIGAAAGSD